MSSRRRTLVPALVLLLGALTACADGAVADPPPTASPVAPTPVSTRTASSGSAELVRRFVDAQAGAQSYAFTLNLVVGMDVVAMAGWTHLGDEPALEVLRATAEAPLTVVRHVGGRTFLNLGEATGDKFVEVHPDDPSDPLAERAVEYAEKPDPGAALAHPDAVVDVVLVDGPGDLDGVPVRTYEVVVDLALAPELRAQLEAGLLPGEETPGTLTYTYVVDPQDRPRQISFDVVGAHVAMSFSAWDEALAVEVPTADELTDRANLS